MFLLFLTGVALQKYLHICWKLVETENSVNFDLF